jgi:hypothetical protein
MTNKYEVHEAASSIQAYFCGTIFPTIATMAELHLGFLVGETENGMKI